MVLVQNLPAEGSFWSTFNAQGHQADTSDFDARARHVLHLPPPPVFRHRR